MHVTRSPAASGRASPSAATSPCSASRRTLEEDFIKRVIGLPGDRMQMKDGVLYINGAAVPKTRVEDYEEPGSFGNIRRMPRFEELLPNGVKYYVLDRSPDRLRRQHGRVRGPARALLHDGRQSRQLFRFPRSRGPTRSATCRSRTSSAAPRSSSSPPTARPTGGSSGNGPSPRAGRDSGNSRGEAIVKGKSRRDLETGAGPSLQAKALLEQA